MVEENARQTKLQLQSREQTANYTWLLAMKERDDFMMEAVFAPMRMNRLPVRHWFDRFDQTYDARVSPSAADAPDNALPAWLDGGLAFPDGWSARVRVELNTVVGELYPLFVWFDASGTGDRASILPDCYEPFLNFRSHGLNSMHPGWLTRREGERITVQNLVQSKQEAAFEAQATPRFTAYPTLYNFLESVDHAVSREKLLGPPSGVLRALALPAAASSVTWSVPRTFTLEGNEQVLTLTVDQPAIRLRRETLNAYTIAKQYSDGQIVNEPFTPVVHLDYLTGGRTLRVVLERQAGGDARWAPREIDSRTGGVTLFRAVYERFDTREDAGSAWTTDMDHRLAAWDRRQSILNAIGTNQNDAKPPFYTLQECTADPNPGLWRLRLSSNIFGSLLMNNVDATAGWLNAYAKELDREQVPPRFMVYNIEALVDWCTQFRGDSTATALARAALVPAYAKASPADLGDHVARLGEQGRLGMACLAAKALAGHRDASSTQRTWATSALASLRTLQDDPATAGPLNPVEYEVSRRTTLALRELWDATTERK